MRALSLWQPWATLIACGAKRIETRGWRPTCVGSLIAIHAAKKQDRDSIALCFEEPFRSALVEKAKIERPGDLPFGAIVATARLKAVHRVEDIRDGLSADERAFGDYRDGRFGWELDEVNWIYRPVPCRGAQGIWQVPDEVLAEMYGRVAV